MNADLLKKYSNKQNGLRALYAKEHPSHWSRVLVVSDTHFGAPYSDVTDADNLLRRGLEYNKEFRQIVKYGLENKKEPATTCVLLGDIYEYINHPLKKDAQAMKAVITAHMEHLFQLVNDHPGCKFIYVIGNHERHPDFDREIDRLGIRVREELGEGRLEITRHYAKIGDGLFIHGDQAMSPETYHVDENNVEDYSGKDGRYNASNTEIKRSKIVQLGHDAGNVLLPRTLGRFLHPPRHCAKKILAWCHEYDERNPGKPPLLEGTNHIFSGHTHDPYTGYDFKDPYENQHNMFSGWYHFHNTGASIFRVGFGKNINRHCFNALNVYLDSGDAKDAPPHIAEVTSFKWPQHSWPKDTELQNVSR